MVALFSWGIGDFLIQKSARKIGNWLALFYIAAFASIALLPFIYKELGPLLINQKGLLILLVASLVLTFAAYFEFEALRIGKISVIEPIYAFEIAVTALLSALLLREHLSSAQLALVLLIMTGIFLVSTQSFDRFKNISWEKGVAIGIMATLAMGAVNFLFGAGARDTSPLLINWFTSVFITLVCLFVLLGQSKAKLIFSTFKKSPALLTAVSVIDNLAWVAFAYATTYIPITIATSISESYIALAAFLGMKLNKEKLRVHQQIGFALVVVAAVTLAAITKD